MTRLYNSFDFTGNISIPKGERFYKQETFEPSGWYKETINFAVQESKTNSAFVKLDGGFSKKKQNVVKSFSKGTENESGSSIEIPWADRNKEETLDIVADFKKVVVDLTTDQEVKDKINQLRYEVRNIEYQDEKSETDLVKLKELKTKLKEIAIDRHEFVHPYDAVVFLSTNLEVHKNRKFRITGDISISHSKGKFYRDFVPTMIEIVSDEEKSKLRATMDVYFTQESLDDVDFEESKKVLINGYIQSYDSGHKKDKFFPTQFVINASKLDFENESHVKRFEFLKKKFDVEDGVYHQQWEVAVFRGADEEEFTEEHLTDSQKEAIEFGYNKLEDFKPKGGVLGETVIENRLVKPNLQKVNGHDFTNGAVITPFEEEHLIYVAPVINKKVEAPKEELVVTENEKPEEVELDDLFG